MSIMLTGTMNLEGYTPEMKKFTGNRINRSKVLIISYNSLFVGLKIYKSK